MRFKNFERKSERASTNKTISASYELGLLHHKATRAPVIGKGGEVNPVFEIVYTNWVI